jgi:hypothetical protein
MKVILQRQLMLKALTISIAVNGAMVFMSLLGGPESLLVRIADAIAAPPGVIAKWVFQPREHSVGAFVAAAAESLGFSVLFYAIAVLLILKAVNWLRSGSRGGPRCSLPRHR